MSKPGKLATAIKPYWEDMERCRQAKAYWSLLHVVACLPDICAALESDNGEATRQRYIDWCEKHFADSILSGDERYRMRCKVLHQGRASTDRPGRYAGFAFGQPADTGVVDHMRVEAGTLHLDVGKLACETRMSVEAWIQWLEANPASAKALNVERNLPSLVRVNRSAVTTQSTVGGGPAISCFNKTN